MPNTIWNIAIATTQALVFSPQLTATTQSRSQSERYITCLSSSAVVHVALASSLHVDTHSPYRKDGMEKRHSHTHIICSVATSRGKLISSYIVTVGCCLFVLAGDRNYMLLKSHTLNNNFNTNISLAEVNEQY